MSRIYVLHGPNLNFLGRRDPEVYGRETLAEIDTRTAEFGARLGLECDCRQSNSEGTLIDWVQEATAAGVAGMVINAAGYSHTSIALSDAVRDFGGAGGYSVEAVSYTPLRAPENKANILCRLLLET
ncbi:MAG: type II 3-dehydroquinate dehydratase, partial [Alphaproteobacteria bacterium]|nr:type II 3-dehydroquinate dehydratase [Alphaproteobacteria bacterium]